MADASAVITAIEAAATGAGVLFPVATPIMTNFCVVGLLVRAALGFVSSVDPNTAALNRIERGLGKINANIRSSRESTEHLIVALNFYTEVSSRVKHLDELMQSLMVNPSLKDKEVFQNDIKNNSPQSLINTMKNLMEGKNSNPLPYTMAKNGYKKTIVSNWRVTVEFLLSRLMLIDQFDSGISGYTYRKSPYMVKQAYQILEILARDENNLQDAYWPHAIHPIIQDVADNRNDVGSQRKAEIIRDRLREIYTTNVFIIIVYNGLAGYDNHYQHSCDHSYLKQYRRNGCNIVIHRSTYSPSDEFIMKFREKAAAEIKTISYPRGLIYRSDDLSSVGKHLFSKLKPAICLAALIKDKPGRDPTGVESTAASGRRFPYFQSQFQYAWRRYSSRSDASIEQVTFIAGIR